MSFFNLPFFQSLVSGIIGGIIGAGFGFFLALRADRWALRRSEQKRHSLLLSDLKMMLKDTKSLYNEFEEFKKNPPKPDQHITAWRPSSSIDLTIIESIRQVEPDDLGDREIADLLASLGKGLWDLKEKIGHQKAYVLQNASQKATTLPVRKEMATYFESEFPAIIGKIDRVSKAIQSIVSKKISA